ncbi:class I tRNA ligase family protein, partial [Ralstonia pseudosolanacearum]|uniref:class I tRNA ligase family protein n=1 Tax=Ralstonia pseudosolanacearum TaxID=1310165 RepID=UPI003D186C09
NELYKVGVEPADVETLAKLLKPFAPHLACEILEKIGANDDEWPVWDNNYLVEDTVEIVVQVNGKLRAKLSVALEDLEDEEKIKSLALADEKVKKFVSDEPKKVIFVKQAKLVNV